MTHQHTDDPTGDGTSELDEIRDPATVADRPDVDRHEHTFVHGDEDHCETGYAGRAIVGVTNDDGAVLAHFDAETPAVVLPNGKVDPGEDYVAAGEAAVEERTGVPVRIESPACVRTVHHRVEGEDEPFETTRQMVFRAAPTTDDPEPVPGGPAADREQVTLAWLSELPKGLANATEPSVDDVARFLD